MTQYIDKSALVVEINRRIKEHHSGYLVSLKDILSFLDTLEVKNVVAEQEGVCNGILNTIIGDTWHIKIPLSKAELKHGDKVKIFITKENKYDTIHRQSHISGKNRK